jgi:benzodiazapine receptor
MSMTTSGFDNRSGGRFASEPNSNVPTRTLYTLRRTVRQWLGLAVSLIICFTAAGIGEALTSSSLADWYPGLAKPAWNPPDWVFGPVWTVLYALMAIAAWIVWRAAGWRRASRALGLFATQLTLNVLWSGLFFVRQNPGAAFLDVLLLWLAILATLVLFWRIDRNAGALLAPYLAWVTFAAVLNFAVWQLNP